MGERVIYFITGNEHKFREVRNMFREKNLNLTLKQLNLSPLEIQAESLKEVALFKLNDIKDKVRGSFFVEDSGFFVDVPLNGFPGVYSSYIFKTIGNDAILRLIDDFSKTRAHFESIIAFYHEPTDQTQVFKGIAEGKISSKKRGNQGFGFDPIFIPDELPNKTYAELPIDVKNQISHRGKAFSKMIEYLKKKL